MDAALWFSEQTGGRNGCEVVVEPNSFAGNEARHPAVSYWQFADGSAFGYYYFLGGSASAQRAVVHHGDLGFEYVHHGGTAGSLYIYDFATGHWSHTGSS
jgi:hypothetical protein